MNAAVVAVDELPRELRETLHRAIQSLADSKRLMGIRYSDWLLGAPSIEAGIAASSMCQDEWGHARLLYAMLKDLGGSPEEIEHDRPAAAYGSVDALDKPFEDWASVVAAMVVVDGAISSALAGFGEGTYGPARSRVPKMLAEETFHADLGEAWFRRLSGASPDAAARLREASEDFLPRTLAWLTPGDAACAALVDAGIFEPEAAARERFGAAVAPLLKLIGIDLGTVEPERSAWDAERGRGPGHPDEESVARARGDRNRMLFVE